MSVNFRHISACCRQAYNGVRRPAVVAESAFALSPRDIPQLIDFFYEDSRIDRKLTDEDLREIFYHLTDLYPEECQDDPDIIDLMSNLAPKDKETRMTFGFAYQRMQDILDETDNRIRAFAMRVVLKRSEPKDAYWFILRLTRTANPFKRRDIIHALAKHHDIPAERLKRESMFTTLKELSFRANEDKLVGVPTIGERMLLPLPRRHTDMEKPFSKMAMEVIRGERLTLHTHPTFYCLTYDPHGEEIETDDIDTTQLTACLPNGIYIVEHTPQDDFPLKVCDALHVVDTEIFDKDYNARREWLEETVSDLLLKEIERVDNMKQVIGAAPKNGVVFLHNLEASTTFTTSPNETVLFSTKHRGEVFRVLGGVWRHEPAKGLALTGWRIGARDGIDGYYEVGTITAEPDVQKRLFRLTEKSTAAEGTRVDMKGATFVEVEVHTADYDERGIHLQGIITDLAPSMGISDVVAVEDIEYLVGDVDE